MRTTGFLGLSLLLSIALYGAPLSGCTRDWSKYGQQGTAGWGGSGDWYEDTASLGSPCSMPGELVPCVCDDGRSGWRACLPDRTYGPCECSGVPFGSAGQGAGGGGYAGYAGSWGVVGGYTGAPPSYDAGRPAHCGNGIIEGPEQCDGMNLNGATCSTLGEGVGMLGCTSVCTYDLSMCGRSGPVDAGPADSGGYYYRRCGNGIIEYSYGEQCDGSNVNGMTCASLGWDYGTLLCDPIECTYDYRLCELYYSYDAGW